MLKKSQQWHATVSNLNVRIKTELVPDGADALFCALIAGRHCPKSNPRYSTKCRGKRDTSRNSPHSISFSQLHFVLYLGNSITFGTVHKPDIDSCIHSFCHRPILFAEIQIIFLKHCRLDRPMTVLYPVSRVPTRSQLIIA